MLRAVTTLLDMILGMRGRAVLGRVALGCVALAGAALAGCEQDDGDPCQVDRDCSGGFCCIGDNALRGICVDPADRDTECVLTDAGLSDDGDEDLDLGTDLDDDPDAGGDADAG